MLTELILRCIKMMQKNLDLLSIYAGLDITYPAADPGASMNQAISCFFKKAENALTLLQPKKNRTSYFTQTRIQKEAV
jgi:hypothetical protein